MGFNVWQKYAFCICIKGNKISQAATVCKQMLGLNIQDQHSDCAVSQRYGVISLVNSPPSTNNIAHALSCSFKRKLNQMGSNRTHKINGIDCVAVICIL